MSGLSLLNQLRRIAAPSAPFIGVVQEIHSDQTSTVQLADGSLMRVRGTSVAVGQPAFVRNGIIEGIAPALTATTVEI